MSSSSYPGSFAPSSVDSTAMAFCIVVSRFNAEISEALLAGAMRGFTDFGIAHSVVTVVHVPGAFEIPLAAKVLANTGKYSAIIGLGAVIRGDTAHFHFVASECARGMQQIALETEVPLIFGVLTTENLDQARERSGDDTSNKGYQCAAAALEMAALLQSVRAGS